MKAAVCLVTEVGVPFDPETAGLIMKYSRNSDMYQPEKVTLIVIHWIMVGFIYYKTEPG